MEIKKSPACRKKGETKDECVSRKIPEIMHENPNMEQDQAIAIAESVCSKSCKLLDEENNTKTYMTKENIQKLVKTDYLTLPEISKRLIKQVRPDLLYRTHMALHKQVEGEPSKKIIRAHKLIAEELKTRGFMHHQWDKLDII